MVVVADILANFLVLYVVEAERIVVLPTAIVVFCMGWGFVMNTRLLPTRVGTGSTVAMTGSCEPIWWCVSRATLVPKKAEKALS